MRVVLHGATNWGSSNFGDFLYGDAIYKHIKKTAPEIGVGFYQPSEYFLNYLGNCKARLWGAKGLIYMPGGYFGQGHYARWIDNAILFLRFMTVGLKAVFFKKEIAVIGVGAGPIESLWLKYPIRAICRKASIITVRDHESYEALTELGVSNVKETSDMILAMDIASLAQPTAQTKEIKAACKGKKLLFVHYNHSEEAKVKFAAAMKRLAEKHPQYELVVGSDCLLPFEEEWFNEFEKSVGRKCIHYRYHSPYELIELLSMADSVLTCKLHVGVVAAMLKKSVICIAEHPEKTLRFYRQIQEKERCISLYSATPKVIQTLLDKFLEKQVTVPVEEIKKASMNFQELDIWIGRL